MRVKTPTPVPMRSDPTGLIGRLRNMLSMVQILRIGANAQGHRRVQVKTRAGDTFDDIPEFQPAGLRHRKTGQSLLISFGGDRRNSFIISTDSGVPDATYLDDGDVSLDDDRGTYIHLTADGPIIECNGKTILMRNAQKLRVEGPIESTGEVTANCDSAPIALSTHLSSNVTSGSDPSGPPVAP